MILTVRTVKEAWDILLIVFEGTDTIYKSRLEILMADFESLWMIDKETMGSLMQSYVVFKWILYLGCQNS